MISLHVGRVVAAAFLAAPCLASAGTLRYASAPGSAETRMTLVREGARLVLKDSDTGRVLVDAPLAGTTAVEVRGLDGDHDDTLTVDLSGGPIPLPGGIDYDGGAGGFDTLNVTGGVVASERHVAKNSSDGTITLDGLEIRYRNLEPTNDTSAATNFTIDLTGSPGTGASLLDGPIVSGFQTSQVIGTGFELINFANKTNVTIIGRGGVDSLQISNPNPGVGLTTLHIQSFDNVLEIGPLVVPNVGVSVSGDILLQNAGNVIGAVEASATVGPILITSTTALQIGGVDAALSGLKVAVAGDIVVNAGGTITLADTDGVGIVAAGSQGAIGGNVSLTAIGAAADIVATVDNDAVASPRGSIVLSAGRDILLGTLGTDHDNDVRASRGVQLLAGRDVTLDGFADVASDDFGQNTGGNLVIHAPNAFTLAAAHGTDATAGAGGTAKAQVQIATSVMHLSAQSASALYSTSGSVQVQADRVIIDAGSGITSTGTGTDGTVGFSPLSVAWNIDLGSTGDAAASTLELSDAELDRVTAPIIAVGVSVSTGPLTVTAPITATTYNQLTLVPGTGGLTQSGTGSLSVPSLLILDGGASGRTWNVSGASVQEVPFNAVPLSGVTDIGVQGANGSDTFNVVPAASATILVTGSGPTPPASPGDQLVLSFSGVTNPVLTNFASGAFGSSGTWTFGNRMNVSFTQLETVPLPPGVAKSFTPSSTTVGVASQLTVTLSNPNASAITGAAFTDTYPSGLVNAATPSISSTCGGTVTATSGTGSLQLSGGTIPASSSCAVSVNVTGSSATAYPNTLAIGAVTTASFGSSSAPASATLTVSLNPAPVVSKSFAPDRIGQRNISTLTVTLANPGTVAITGAAFTDTYPAGLVNAESPNVVNTCGGSVTAAAGEGSLSLSGGTIPTTGCSISVVVTSNTPGVLTNTIVAGGVTSTNAFPSASDASADLTVVAVSIPTLGGLGLLALSMLLAAAGFLALRRG